MNEKQEHRITGLVFKSNADFRRWKWKLVRLYAMRFLSILFTFKKEYIYAAFLMEIQRVEKFEEINKRWQAKIMEG